MHKPTISPHPTHIPQRPVNRFADGNSFMCPTDVMKTALQNDSSKPAMHPTINNSDSGHEQIQQKGKNKHMLASSHKFRPV